MINGKVEELKNINMIFIGGNYKDAYLIIEKSWYDEEGALITDAALIAELNKLLSFNNKLGLGMNIIEITNYTDAALGKKVTVTEGAIPGYEAWENPKSAKVKWDDNPIKVVAFDNQKLWGKIKIEKEWDHILADTVAPDVLFDIYNANGVLVVADAELGIYYNVKSGEGPFKVVEQPIPGYTPEEGTIEGVVVEAGGKVTVSFANKEDRATVEIKKVWSNGDTFDPVDTTKTIPAVSFTNDYELGKITVKAGKNIAFEEDPVTLTFVDDDYTYTFEFEKVEVDGVVQVDGNGDPINEVDFNAVKDAEHVITFYNKWVRVPLPATVIIEKLWFDGDDPFDGDDDLVELTNGWTLGEHEVAGDSDVIFNELPFLPPDNDVWGLVDISINGVPVANVGDGVNFVARRNTTYTIVLTNWKPFTIYNTLKLAKYADGDPIAKWMTENAVIDISLYIDGFALYKYDPITDTIIDYNPATWLVDEDWLDWAEVSATGNIEFLGFNATAGWYAIVESLTALGKTYFNDVAPLIIEFDGNNIVGGGSTAYVSGADYGKIVGNAPGGIYNLPDTWNNAISALGSPDKDIVDKLLDLGAEWIWDDEDTYQYGVTGDVKEFKIPVEVPEDVTVTFYFAADNAAVVYVNGKMAGWTTVALRGPAPIGAAYVGTSVFGGLTYGDFDGGWAGGWVHAYAISIDLEEGDNEIIVIAANSKQTVGTGTENDGYNTTNNPCGVVFGFEAPATETVFENVTATPKHKIDLNKLVEGQAINAWMYANEIADISLFIEGFNIYKVSGYGANFDIENPLNTTIAELQANGKIVFEGLEPGWYAIVEVLTPEGEKTFDDVGAQYFEVIDGDVEGAFDNKIMPPGEPDYLGRITSQAHVKEWIKYGIYCLAGNTTSYKNGMYFVAVIPNFFDYVESFTVVYGSSPTANAGRVYTAANFTGPQQMVFGKGNWAINRNVLVVDVTNPFGSGARHAYLTNITFKAGVTLADFLAAVAQDTIDFGPMSADLRLGFGVAMPLFIVDDNAYTKEELGNDEEEEEEEEEKEEEKEEENVAEAIIKEEETEVVEGELEEAVDEIED